MGYPVSYLVDRGWTHAQVTSGIKGSCVADTCGQTYKCLLGAFHVVLCFLLYKLQLSCCLQIRSHYLAQASFKHVVLLLQPFQMLVLLVWDKGFGFKFHLILQIHFLKIAPEIL